MLIQSVLVNDEYQAEWAERARGPDNNSCMTAYLARNEKEQKALNSGRLTMMEAKKTKTKKMRMQGEQRNDPSGSGRAGDLQSAPNPPTTYHPDLVLVQAVT